MVACCPPLPSSLPLYLIGCIPVVVCYETKVKLLFKQAEACKSLRMIIKIGSSVNEEEKALSKETGITIHTMDDVLVSEKC